MKSALAVLSVVVAAVLTFTPRTMAQAGNAPNSQSPAASQSSIDKDVQMLRQDLRSSKKQIIAANLQLTDSDATKFWPVYDQYVTELTKINDEKYALVKEYAAAWGNIKDDQALSLINRALALEDRATQLRIKYVPIFNNVVAGSKVATFFQIERWLQSLIDLQWTAQLPLVQTQ
jgi:hypothetical protein